MQESFGNKRNLIPVAIIALMLLLGIFVTVSMLGGSGGTGTGQDLESDLGTQINEKTTAGFLGVVKDIDTQINAISIMDINGGSDTVLYFNGGTDIRDKYNKIISMSQITLGEMVDVSFNTMDNKIIKLNISKDAWEYKEVEKFKIDNPQKRIAIADSLYQFDDRLVIASNDRLITQLDLNDKDLLTVKGVGQKVCSVIVAEGHGYIRLSNYNDFMDGTIEVGYHIILPVVKDMLITAREGDYKVTLEKGNLKGTKRIHVSRDQEVILDMSEYHAEAEKVGSVDFLIQPFGATLYVDGEETDYENSVDLLYGNHVIKVTADGYSNYSGFLTVDESGEVVEINLAEAGVSTDLTKVPATDTTTGTNSTNTTGTNTTGTNTTGTTGTTPTTTTTTDSARLIKITEPVGAEVYLNGVLKGTVPCNFTKEIGTLTLTFAKSGYVTKSYSITTKDDAQDATLSFPAMEALEK